MRKVEEVRQEAFEYLSEYDSFFQFKINDSPFHLASVTDFRATRWSNPYSQPLSIKPNA